MLGMARYGTRDIVRAKAFYDGIAEVLGAKRAVDRLAWLAIADRRAVSS